jgi:hypothetical protein
MYRRPKFLEILLEIRREMALEADYDVELFAEIARSGSHSVNGGNGPAKQSATEPAVIPVEGSELRKSQRKIQKK